MANGNKRSGGVMDVVGLIAVLLFVGGPLLAWLRVVPALLGFYMFLLGSLVSIIVAIALIVSLIRGRGAGLGRLLAAAAAVVFVVAAVRSSGDRSMINDYTTNLDDPPAFRHAATLPPNQGRDLTYPPAFAEIQRKCCADLQPVRLPTSALETVQRAQTTAAQMPHWTITQVDAANGTIEATAESVLFGFQDDVVIRIRPDGGASIVDMRSKSRDGRGDMGVNAARIRSYVGALKSGNPPPAS